MIRVLHLSSSTPDFHTQRLMAALQRHAGDDFSITARDIGRGGTYRTWHFAYFDIRRNAASQFDVIHAFTIPALDASAGMEKVVYSPSAPLTPRMIHDVSLNKKMSLQVVCASLAEQRVHAANGIPAGQCHIVPPPIDFTRVPGARNSELRTALGFGPDDQVFLLPGESDRRSGHHDALWTVSILHVLHRQCRALLWGRGDAINPLERLSQKLRQPNLLTIAERKLGRRIEFEELPSVADAALFAPTAATSWLPIALCMAAGLPIIATKSPWLQEMLRDGDNAALVSPPTPRMLAQRIVELRRTRVVRQNWVLGAKEAREKFRVDRVVSEYCGIYRRIAANAPFQRK